MDAVSFFTNSAIQTFHEVVSPMKASPFLPANSGVSSAPITHSSPLSSICAFTGPGACGSDHKLKLDLFIASQRASVWMANCAEVPPTPVSSKGQFKTASTGSDVPLLLNGIIFQLRALSSVDVDAIGQEELTQRTAGASRVLRMTAQLVRLISICFLVTSCN